MIQYIYFELFALTACLYLFVDLNKKNIILSKKYF